MVLGAMPYTMYAQSDLFGKDFASAKLLFIDHGNPNGIDSLDMTNGLEVAYRRNFGKYLSLALPLKFAQADVHNDINKRNFFSVDALLRLQYYEPEHIIVPYLFGGAGYVFEVDGENNNQIPLGLGVDIRLGRSSYLNIQGEYRISSLENRNNMQAGLGLTYRLGDKKPDADGDNIPDDQDQCPQKAGLADFMGCPDTDMDGIQDREDGCPEVAGPAKTNGCPDTDSDGIIDAMDECPEEAGDPEYDGCPDSDGDGLVDNVDNCPQEYGTLEGCPDQDGDGIADSEDNCPEEAGSLNNQGCPIMDQDGDGFADAEDDCPDMAGPLNGCPDQDGDGIADNEDDCPEQPGTQGNQGCPNAEVTDSDGDGFADEEDDCPEVGGTLNGCPDTDNDGFADEEDDCPEVSGTLNGCPDTDGDGIADSEDNCPEEKGTRENRGCPKGKVDGDGDGFADEEDDCPQVAGPVNGCPDEDGDGVADRDDVCPREPGTANNRGCPLIAEEDQEALNYAMKNVRFEPSSSRLTSDSYEILDQIIVIMDRYPSYTLFISGHTDSLGDDRNNQILSEERARSCFQYLLANGVEASRMRYEGYGETRPIADNATHVGRKLNRRVEFELRVP